MRASGAYCWCHDAHQKNETSAQISAGRQDTHLGARHDTVAPAESFWESI